MPAARAICPVRPEWWCVGVGIGIGVGVCVGVVVVVDGYIEIRGGPGCPLIGILSGLIFVDVTATTITTHCSCECAQVVVS